ncbi:MAG: endonuclease/exonuclease/phosphatase family protein [Hyphomicrobiaceae bacterium]|nr:endonuclease/exonuclease/phosphatase family protein [Hyphomicrobiaceae bacterium]
MKVKFRNWLNKALDEQDERSGLAVSWILLLVSGAILLAIVIRGWWPSLDILSPLGPHAFAVAAVASIGVMLGRWRPFFLISSLGFIVLVPSLLSLDSFDAHGRRFMPWHGAAAGAHDSAPQLRVLAINTWHDNGNLERLTQYIATADADVVVMSEFGPNKLAMLEALRPAYPYQASCAKVWACSQVLLSRVPFDRSGTRLPTLKNPPIVWAEFRVGTVDAAKVTVVGTHIYRPSRRLDWHLAQLAGLADMVRKIDGAVIVAGDFNMTRMSQSFDDFTYASGLASPERLLASWPAWPFPLPQFQLDYVFVSKDLKVVDQRLGHSIGSDHLPLWSTIRMPVQPSIMAMAKSRGRALN